MTRAERDYERHARLRALEAEHDAGRYMVQDGQIVKGFAVAMEWQARWAAVEAEGR